MKGFSHFIRLFALFTFFLPTFSAKSQELQRIGFLQYPAPSSLSGCWHQVDHNGGEWALVGTNVGLSIVDVNNPAQPVERFMVPGVVNNWRELRTGNGYAYVGSEGQYSGITIVDLRHLPDSVNWKVWRGDGIYDSLVIKSHTVQVADGYLYISGGSSVTNGVIIADLADPWNPHIVGKYANEYVHDVYVRGDTMWTNEIYKGWFGVVDITDRTNPVLITTQPTPNLFPHNCELNPQGNVLFTTDERQFSPLAAYDISNLDDIQLLDLYRVSKKPNGEVHNVRVFNDFLLCPSYAGQLTIVDATRPFNLIETAWDSVGNSLVWDADPYLPSGIVLATGKIEGLSIYKKPTYKHASWLEGRVFNGATGSPLSNAKVFVQGTLNADTTRSDGVYRTGAADQGTYTVYAEHPGFSPATIQNVVLNAGQVTQLDISLLPATQTQSPDLEALIRVSPSPFSNDFTVEIPQDSPFAMAEFQLKLTDATGKLLVEKRHCKGPSVLVDGLSKLPSGAYFLSISGSDSGQRTIQLMK